MEYDVLKIAEEIADGAWTWYEGIEDPATKEFYLGNVLDSVQQDLKRTEVFIEYAAILRYYKYQYPEFEGEIRATIRAYIYR